MSDDRPATRFYYMRWLKWMLRCYGTMAALVSLALTAEPIPVVLRALSGVFALGWFSITWFGMAASIGVEVRSDGIRIGHGFRRRFVAWREIKGFAVLRPGAVSPSVSAELSHGGHLSTGLVQGRKIRWRDGVTRDITAVLNRELETSKANAAGPDHLRASLSG